MFKKAKALLFVILFLTTTVCYVAKIPEQIGNWLVTVGPAGNAVYRPPKTIPEDTPPSEAVLGIPAIFVLHLRVTDWKIDDGEYEIECEKGDEQYQFTVRPDGTLLELQYENDETNIKEEADELVYEGTKKAGAKFSFGTNNGGRELGHLEYCRRMARECGLTIKDMFSPRPEGNKTIQRRRVSR